MRTIVRFAMETDLYDILQVAPHAEPEVIESAYKRLALKYHPDVNNASDAHARMRALNHAYEILRDPAARARYDQERAALQFERRRPTRRAAPKKRARAKSKTRARAKWTPPPKPRRETVQEAVAVNEALIAAALALARLYPTLTSEILQRHLGIKYPRALNLYATLLERGWIDDEGAWQAQDTQVETK